ncbi:MAG: polysaccharide biosynthesis/export family protein [Terriglobia bacterium]
MKYPHRFIPLLRTITILFVLTALAVAPDGAPIAQTTTGEGDGTAQDPASAGSARLVFPLESQYRIGIEDVLLISVWRDPDLTREVPVRPDGKISLPLLQDLMAAGKTPVELGQELQTRFKEFLSNPSVTVIVREVNSIKLYILGEVARPGPVTVRSKVRLLQAISMAGGVTQFGGKNGVVIYRNSPAGEKVIEVSYKDIVSGKRPGDNLVLEPGDTIVVR